MDALLSYEYDLSLHFCSRVQCDAVADPFHHPHAAPNPPALNLVAVSASRRNSRPLNAGGVG